MRIILILAFIIFIQDTNCFNLIKEFKKIIKEMNSSLKSLAEKVQAYFIRRLPPPTAPPGPPAGRKVKKDVKSFSITSKNTSGVNESIHNLLFRTQTAIPHISLLTKLHKRRIESHIVHTKDGYLLTLHHLLKPIDFNVTKLTNQTVLLNHGLFGSSTDWILLGPNQSLAYMLADAGCDVWMANARGNVYSQGHITRKLETKQFWNFTFQEMGIYDLPAILDYIVALKNDTDPINYIGHSMGATSLLVLLSLIPRYNQYLRIGILLAPLAFMTDIKSPLKVYSELSPLFQEQITKSIGNRELTATVPEWIAEKYCRGPLIFCSNSLFFLAGVPTNYYGAKYDRWEKILNITPAGGSTNIILHYAEMANSDCFHKFHDLSSGFPLKNVDVPLVLMSSTDDLLATVSNVDKLYFSIASPIDHKVILNKNISHTDFLWGTDAGVLVFDKVMDLLENGLRNRTTRLNEV